MTLPDDGRVVTAQGDVLLDSPPTVDEHRRLPADRGGRRGSAAGRRAVVRWASRLLRRDLRQHLLILCLLTVAIAAATGFAAAAYNLAPTSGQGEFGVADHFLVGENLSPEQVTTTLDAATAWFGTIDPIGHRPVPLPGTIRSLDLRSQQVGGPYGGPTLDVRSGRAPVAEHEVALTDGLIDELGVEVGDVAEIDGVQRTVVGLVENPSNLDDEFVLLPPSAIVDSAAVTILVRTTDDHARDFLEGASGIQGIASRGDIPDDVLAAVLVLVVSTLVLFLVALIAAASFTVIAQRRLPQLGMLAAIGATEKQVRLTMIATGAVTGLAAGLLGALIGLGGWLVISSRMDAAVGFRIDPWNLPWWLLLTGVALAVVTATAAAWWPARTMARIPPVLALSGRPPNPAAIHRSAALSIALIIGGAFALGEGAGAGAEDGITSVDLALIGIGMLAIVAGVLLVSPLALRALATCASRLPVASRIALRDLSRYQARSGAALAAIALALGIPIALIATAAAAQNNAGPGNLAEDQLIVRVAKTGGPFVPDVREVADVRAGVDAITAAVPGATLIQLDAAADPDAPRDPRIDAAPAVSLARRVENGWADFGTVFVASSELLDEMGLGAGTLEGADIATDRQGELQITGRPFGPGSDRTGAEPLTSPTRLPETYSSLPHALISPERLAERGWEAVPSGLWLVVSPGPFSEADLDAARLVAAENGLEVEAREAPTSLATLRLGSVAIGMVLALGILAMTVGLIRAESTGELRTLTASGATSSTRRAVSATTAGGLAALGALLGIAGAYLALAAGRVADLTPLPSRDLALVAIGTPIVATVAGWLLAGREPAALARRPLD